MRRNFSLQFVVFEYSRIIIMWNVNACEFTPNGAALLRAEAPAFVPLSLCLKSQVREIISEQGLSGVRVGDIPDLYFQKNGTPIDLSSTDLSLLVASLEEVTVASADDWAREGAPKNLAEAMHAAGFSVALDDAVQVDAKIGGDKIAKLSLYVNYVEDLALFRQSIVDVVYNFSLKNIASGSGSGLALSLFAAEWDRFHTVRGITADLKTLRDRFFVVKLMPFLQAVPELDVVGAHPEVRVRIRAGVVCQSVPPSPRRKNWLGGSSTPSPLPSPDTSTYDGNSARNISLNSELFGTDDYSRPSTPGVSNAQELQTRVVLEEMLSSTQTQILGILSQVPADPLAAASAIDQMNQLQVLVNALKAALAVLPPAAAVEKRKISIEKAIFGEERTKKTTISLESLLSRPEASSCPPSPLSAAASAAPGVGNLLADLSRILFAQVIQQQQATPETTVRETNCALEKTLADIISAASSPPSSPVSQQGATDCSALVSGQLIIPRSLPSSPIPMAPQSLGTTPALGGEAEDSMHALLKGLMHALPPPGMTEGAVESKKTTACSSFKRMIHPVRPLLETDESQRVYGKEFLIAARQKTEAALVPAELAGLSCKQMLRTLPPHKLKKSEEIPVAGPA